MNKTAIKNIFNSTSSGLIVYQANEEHGFSGLCQIIKNLPTDRKVSGVFEGIVPTDFDFPTNMINLKKGVSYSQLLKEIKPTKNQIVIVENPRDKETFDHIFKLIQNSSCLALVWLRGPSLDPSFAENLFLDFGYKENGFFNLFKCLIYQDFSFTLKDFKDPI